MTMYTRRQPRGVASALFAAVAILGISTALAQQGEPAPAQPASELKIKVGSGVGARSSAVDAYVLMENTGQQWKIVEISRRRLSVTDPASQELLVFANEFSYVEPVYWEYYQFELNKKSAKDSNKAVSVDPYVCFSGQKNDRPKYNPCDSKLTQASDLAKTAFANTIMTIFSLGTANATLGLGSAASVDREKVLAVLKDTNAIEVARQYVRRSKYRSAFEQAKTAGDYRTFMEKYKGDDPDSLIPDAEAKLDEFAITEKTKQLELYRSQFATAKTGAEFRAFIQRYESSDPEQLISKARQNLKVVESEERRQAAAAEDQARKVEAAKAEQKRREVAALSSWRGRLKIGDDTFCGPVIELRQPMVKIAVRAQLPGYASEAWLKASEIFPAEAGCDNNNGRLRPAYR